MATDLDAAIDRIAAGLRRLRNRRFVSPLRHDEGGRLRIIAPHKEFEQIMKEGLRPLREAVERSPVVADYLERSLGFADRELSGAAGHRERMELDRPRRSS